MFLLHRRFLTRQRQIPHWVAFCFGQAAVLTAAVLQDVSSRRHSVLWITHNVKHATVSLFADGQMQKQEEEKTNRHLEKEIPPHPRWL